MVGVGLELGLGYRLASVRLKLSNKFWKDYSRKTFRR